MRRWIVIACLAAAAPALAQPDPPQPTPRRNYDFWTRCTAMFAIKSNEANKAGNTPESMLWEQRANTARANVLKEIGTLNIARDEAEKTAATMTEQFAQTLAGGNVETDAQFERAADICTGALMPDAH